MNLEVATHSLLKPCCNCSCLHGLDRPHVALYAARVLGALGPALEDPKTVGQQPLVMAMRKGLKEATETSGELTWLKGEEDVPRAQEFNGDGSFQYR